MGNTAAPAYSAPAAAPVVAPAAQTAKAEPMLDDTETYFNNGIKQAVAKGDIGKALKLMNEAERLGSKSARSTFIGAVKARVSFTPQRRCLGEAFRCRLMGTPFLHVIARQQTVTAVALMIMLTIPAPPPAAVLRYK